MNILSISIVTFFIFAAGIYLSLDNYYYMDKSGLYYDELWEIEKTEYSWDEITEMKQINKKEGGTLIPEKLIFTYSNEKIELPLSPKLRNEIDPVIDYLENTKGLELIYVEVTAEEE